MKKIFLILAFSFSFSDVYSQRIAAGRLHSLGICVDGKVRSWGDGEFGQLGNKSISSATAPQSVAKIYGASLPPSGIVKVAGGEMHSMALKDDGLVYVWGRNNFNQLGDLVYNSNRPYSNVPVGVDYKRVSDIIDIAAGGNHCLAVKKNGTVMSWGYNYNGQCGVESTKTMSTTIIKNFSGVIKVAAGYDFSLALKSDGTVWSWGANSNGQLGNGTTTDNYIPAQVSNLTEVIAISGGFEYCIALKSDGTVWTWGKNQYGQLGNNTSTDSKVPIMVGTLSGISAIAAGYKHSLALQNDGTVWAWGDNQNGSLGNGTFTFSYVPIKVKNLTGIISISAGDDHSLVVKSDGTVWAWGANSNGQLGVGSNEKSNVPVNPFLSCQVVIKVNNPTENPIINFFPNPAFSKLNLNINSDYLGEKYVIYDNIGNSVLSGIVSSEKSIIELYDLSAGIYFFKVGTNFKQLILVNK